MRESNPISLETSFRKVVFLLEESKRVISEFGMAIAMAMPGNPQPEPISIYL